MHDDELLVMGSRATDALVQQHLPTGCVDDVGEFGLFLLVEPHPPDASATTPRTCTPRRASRVEQTGKVRTVVGQLLVIVTTPIGQAEEVARCERSGSLGETRE